MNRESQSESQTEVLSRICNDYSNILVTRSDLESDLKEIIQHVESSVQAIRITITSVKYFSESSIAINVDSTVSGSPTNVKTITLDPYGTQCKIECWKRNSTSILAIPNEFEEGISKLIKCYWKGDNRDAKSWLLSRQIQEIENELIDRTIDRYSMEHIDTAILYCDLDNFKAVNSELGHNEADVVILKVAAKLDSLMIEDAILIHQSGDEFNIVIKNFSAENTILFAKSIIESLSNEDFHAGSAKVGISFGIYIKSHDLCQKSFRECIDIAETALQPTPQLKHRGRARIRTVRNGSSPSLDLDMDNKVYQSIAALRAGLSEMAPFASPWLNIFSSEAFSVINDTLDNLSLLQDKVLQLVNWISAEINSGLVACDNKGEQFSDEPIYSNLDILFGIAHGVYRTALHNKEFIVLDGLKIKYSDDHSYCELLSSKDNAYVRIGDAKPIEKTAVLGSFKYIEGGKQVQESDIDIKNMLLLTVGFTELSVPSKLFSGVIVVDDRPVIGGELPDFWEASLAQVLTRVIENPNIDVLFVIGDKSSAPRTTGELEKINNSSSVASYLSKKTGIDYQNIQEAEARLARKIIFCKDESELRKQMAVNIQSPDSNRELRKANYPRDIERFLSRKINTKGFRLGSGDGCRVESIYQAFPIVVDACRNSGAAKNITDQAGRRLRELIDFKVVLTNPALETVPSFYQHEQDSLQSYLKRAFTDDNSLFGKVFEKNNQLRAVLNHIVQIAKKSAHTTRRAILIVPHETSDASENLTPLGLVSIRIIPRFTGMKIVFDFSYSWRTVETLVGFPYSIYGSVGYSLHLIEKIKKLLNQENIELSLALGEISYVAQSLHMFSDSYGESIARRIVDEASV